MAGNLVISWCWLRLVYIWKRMCTKFVQRAKESGQHKIEAFLARPFEHEQHSIEGCLRHLFDLVGKRCRSVAETATNMWAKCYYAAHTMEFTVWFQIQLGSVCSSFNKMTLLGALTTPYWGVNSVGWSWDLGNALCSFVYFQFKK